VRQNYAKTTPNLRQNLMGLTLKKVRKTLSMTQAQLATHLGLAVRSYQRYEIGEKSFRHLVKEWHPVFKELLQHQGQCEQVADELLASVGSEELGTDTLRQTLPKTESDLTEPPEARRVRLLAEIRAYREAQAAAGIVMPDYIGVPPENPAEMEKGRLLNFGKFGISVPISEPSPPRKPWKNLPPRIRGGDWILLVARYEVEVANRKIMPHEAFFLTNSGFFLLQNEFPEWDQLFTRNTEPSKAEYKDAMRIGLLK
jgi:transcriptional regulator with XRE-family HTH domain